MQNLRIWFCKTGRAKYVSHLDLNRCMLRAFRRSGLPIWYTEGFNPHPYMTFALPLPLGVESVEDIMDIKIDAALSGGEVVSRLNAVLPEGLQVTRAAEPWGKVNEIFFAEYELFFDPQNVSAEAVIEILSRNEIICERMGKQGGKKVMKEFNLAEFIKEYSFESRGNFLVLLIRLCAGSNANANPMLLAEVLCRESGGTAEALNIRRVRLLSANGTVFS